MKRMILFAAGYFASQSLFAQEPSDALRYSWTVPGGTARVQAIGGAMGSLGGDVTAAYVNPAGLAFFRTSDLVLSPQLRFGKTKATYLGRTETEQQNKLTWGTTGAVFGSGTSNGNLRSASFALAYNRSADFNSNFIYQGANNRSSYSQKYLEEVRGQNANAVASNYPFGASLALNTYYIDTIRGANGGVVGFKSMAPVATGLLQRQTMEQRGGIDEFALGGAVNVNDKVMIGATLGIPILHYKRIGQFGEADSTNNMNNRFESAIINEDLSTSGTGLNARLGVIFKPQEYWRIGLAFHTPTLYSLTDKYFVEMITDTEGYMGIQNQNSDFVNGGSSEFKYVLTTPYRAIASVSYVIREIEDVSKQRGFLTADLEYVNYKAASYQVDEESGNDQSTKEYFRQLNRAIDEAYKGTFNLRVGGELKFTTLMVRAGAAYFGNPYQNINGEKGSRMNLSGGLGYRDKGFFIDLTYVYAMNKDVHYAYRLQDPNAYAGARLRQNLSNVQMTLGFKL